MQKAEEGKKEEWMVLRSVHTHAVYKNKQYGQSRFKMTEGGTTAMLQQPDSFPVALVSHMGIISSPGCSTSTPVPCQ